MKTRVVVTGMGAITPIGNDVESFWQGLKDKTVGIGPITYFDTTDYKCKLAAEVKGFDPKQYMDAKAARRMEAFSQFAVAASKEALEQSGIDMEKEDPYRVGVCVGSGIGSLQAMEKDVKKLNEKGPSRVNPLLVPLMISNMAAGNVAIQFGLKGKCFNVVTACATGTHSIGEAFRSIQYGEADVMVAGGAEASITPIGIAGFTSLTALNTTEDASRASIPFDEDRNGFVMGEGAGVVVLESLEHAKARGANILAEVVGYGATCDAFHITAPRPDGSAGARAIQLALQEAGHQAGERVYINAHGTGTPMNDSLETQVVKLALGEEEAKKAYMSSTKSMTGHMLGAAGAIEALACLKALNEGVLPPTINLLDPDPACDLNYVPNQAIHTEVDLVLSNSLGFGGHNACIAFRKVTR